MKTVKKITALILAMLLAMSTLWVASSANEKGVYVRPFDNSYCTCWNHTSNGPCHCCIYCDNLDTTYLLDCCNKRVIGGEEVVTFCCSLCDGLWDCECVDCECCAIILELEPDTESTILPSVDPNYYFDIGLADRNTQAIIAFYTQGGTTKNGVWVYDDTIKDFQFVKGVSGQYVMLPRVDNEYNRPGYYISLPVLNAPKGYIFDGWFCYENDTPYPANGSYKIPYGSEGTVIEFRAIYRPENFEPDRFGEGLTFSVENGEATVEVCGRDTEGKIEIPSTYEGCPVTAIGVRAFAECAKITEIVIPESITYIGQNAFSACLALEEIFIPKSVTSIAREAFTENLSLKRINVDENNPNYTSDADGILFNKDKTVLIQYPAKLNKTTYEIPNSVKKIKTGCFMGNIYLEEINIPDSVVTIEEMNFSACPKLKELYIPESVVVTGEESDTGYYIGVASESLEKITVSENSTAYYTDENGVLYSKDKKRLLAYPAGNKNTTFTVPDEVEIINYSSLANCKNIKQIIIPESVERLCDSYLGVYIYSFDEETGSFIVEAEPTIIPDLTIYGVIGSAAESHAKEFGITFADISEVPDVHTHSYTWATEKEATIFEKGLEKGVCSCGEETTREIDVIPTEEKTNGEATLIFKDNAVAEDAELKAEKVTDGNIKLGDYTTFTVYDINIVAADGENIQPNGKVWIKLPVPEGYNLDTTAVYYVADDGNMTEMNSFIDSGYIFFETDHFSKYAVIDKSKKAETEPEKPTEPENPSKNCSCNCHKTGIAKFFWSIINFFQKLFGQNKVCACGAKH